MTSIHDFSIYLRNEGELTLRKMEISLRGLTVTEVSKWEGVKLSLSHFLNNLYFEMLDFMTWLEQEFKYVQSKMVKALISDLKKDLEMVLHLREEVITTGSFTRQDLFLLIRQQLLQKIQNLRKALQDYVHELEVLEKELSSTSAVLQYSKGRILQVLTVLEKVKQRIEATAVSNFLSIRDELSASLQDLSGQLQEEQRRLRKLREVTALKRALISISLAKANLEQFARTIQKTDPGEWKQSAVSFDYFKQHLLKQLEGTAQILAGSTEELKEAQQQLAA
ncbi:MAG TPA: hypothetical protein VJA18_00015 [Candidatus Nanoarchaeia archaeon]|nr:hypothetical protein [Candidatus Nanoarchaeia archaeon]